MAGVGGRQVTGGMSMWPPTSLRRTIAKQYCLGVHRPTPPRISEPRGWYVQDLLKIDFDINLCYPVFLRPIGLHKEELFRD